MLYPKHGSQFHKTGLHQHTSPWLQSVMHTASFQGSLHSHTWLLQITMSDTENRHCKDALSDTEKTLKICAGLPLYAENVMSMMTCIIQHDSGPKHPTQNDHCYTNILGTKCYQ